MTTLKKLALISIALLISSCGTPPVTQNTNPYPTLPIWATEIILLPGSGDNFEARGNEPFWSAEITASGVSFTRPGESTPKTVSYTTRQENRENLIVARDAKWEFFVTLKKEKCSDGMSDKEYSYSVTVALGAENLKGCANKK